MTRAGQLGTSGEKKVTVAARFLLEAGVSLLFTCNRVIFVKPLNSGVLRPKEVEGAFFWRLGRGLESTSKKGN